MKKGMLLLAMVLLIITAVCTGAMAEDNVCGDGLTWSYDEENCVLTITGTGSMDDYYNIQGKAVPWNSRTVKSVVIESGVTHIGSGAFAGNSWLSSVTIPDSVTSIGDNAFSCCYGLAEIIIPENVKSIGDFAFDSCESLKSIVIPASVQTIGVNSFSCCSALEEVTVAGTPEIRMGAFWECTKLSSVSIPEGAVLGEAVFYGCHLLCDDDGFVVKNGILFEYSGQAASAVIPAGVRKISAYAFRSGTMSSVSIPDSVTDIGPYAFYLCTNLGSIEIPINITVIRQYTFSGCSNLSGVSLAGDITAIEQYAFSGCSNLENIEIPSTVTSIGSYAFSGCSSLSSLNVPETVATIGTNAFSRCTGLQDENGIVEIHGILFGYYGTESSLTVPATVRRIDRYIVDNKSFADKHRFP